MPAGQRRWQGAVHAYEAVCNYLYTYLPNLFSGR